ncbi:enoyl-CoA hydratase/isomerase family protein [Nocardia sp. bgisy118]|uniref:enoyl-CoA hydratase/isomerase family protein n=1 Tax=Nocardia sp. bgisy118 TaxID=3413786 RepID=UPI003F49DF44
MSEILHDRASWTVTARIARITPIRGAGNALDMAAAKGLREAADRVTHGAVDGSVRVAVIAAEGPTFCVGGDLREFATAPDRGPHVATVAAELHQAILTFTRAPIPVVSVVHGTVAGGGIGLALAADIVLMATTRPCAWPTPPSASLRTAARHGRSPTASAPPARWTWRSPTAPSPEPKPRHGD